MSTLTLSRATRVFALLALIIASPAAWADESLHYIRVDLLDGRTLKDVLFKTYDSGSGKLLVEVHGKVQLVPMKLIPPPIAERLKSVVPQGTPNVSIVAVPPASKEESTPLKTEPEAAAPAGYVDPYSPAEVEKRVALHLKVAEARATNYFQFEFQGGSNYISVTVANLETDNPVPVDGWTGRYRTEGKAYLEFYDSKGHTFQRTTSNFEVITEQKTITTKPKAIDFIRK